ncbi:unnamed protein product, partial [Dovyalis caffra]
KNWRLEQGFACAKNNLTNRCFPSVLVRIGWNANVYGIWKERSSRIHGNGSISL